MGYYFQGGTADDWVITQGFLRGETVNLDTVDNSITSALLSGTSLKMVISQYHTITQTFNRGGGEIHMNIVNYHMHLSHYIERHRLEQDMDTSDHLTICINDGTISTTQ